ncbi:MAG: helix-turn-helix transcriptional regulator [Vulcanimicrobiaceae bacterium]
MHEARFFQSTRGKIVAALRRRHAASAVDLASEFRLSANAVRQHLVFLERDGLVVERSVRRGPTKPTLEYSLTTDGEALFPQQYDRMLGAVLREVRESFGAGAVRGVFERIGERQAAVLKSKTDQVDFRGKIEVLAESLRDHGVEADVIQITGGFALREHNCPYAKTVGEHPEVCSAIHTVFEEILPGSAEQVESLATGGTACRFDIREAPANNEGVATK